ncbi:MAG TPA: dihydrodipicolinate synthase family protein [Gemmatimonadaceae bacterium]|nr:dihydrodipicolinate synthase family protein [Gemmatimonadaceae bacterium]
MDTRAHLQSGVVIPAHPLALTQERAFDETRQRVLTRYYVDAGAGGIAVGVHTTQFAIREHGMYAPVLALAAETARAWIARAPRPFVLVAGLAGATAHACAEASTARSLGYDVGLLSLGAMAKASDAELIAHCRAVADVMPLFGFYLQPAVGGRVLSYAFWRAFAEIDNVWAIKIAPFNRYATSDVVRAVADAGRTDIALYTGNDDNIVGDLVTPFPTVNGVRYIDGGLLGQWAVWTQRAVAMLAKCKSARATGASADLLREGAALTDANSAVFDAANGFAGCIAGIHEILRRQGLFAGTWCLDPKESLSPGQADEIERVCRAYPQLVDDEFVSANRDRWFA